MRFGHFYYPMNFDESKDSQAIDNCLYQAELVEELGMDAIWLAEHHFTGEVVYGDSLMFATAVALKTKRVLIGLGIVEMGLHHPVRVAIQTALLDNLSHGRLVVGTGRGSNYNAFEYAGFGTTMTEGSERLEEAEDLLIKAWTTENLSYEGKFWQVTFPAIRPRPYQKPHPPLARSCIADESVIAMAKIGRPLLLRGRSTDGVGRSIALYHDHMLAAGFDEPAVEDALDKAWVWREAFVAETDDEAQDVFLPAYEHAFYHISDIRERWNPPDQPAATQNAPLSRSSYGPAPDPGANEALVGSPKRIAEQIALLQDAGVRNIFITDRGLLSKEQTTSSLRLFSEKVIPLFR